MQMFHKFPTLFFELDQTYMSLPRPVELHKCFLFRSHNMLLNINDNVFPQSNSNFFQQSNYVRRFEVNPHLSSFQNFQRTGLTFFWSILENLTLFTIHGVITMGANSKQMKNKNTDTKWSRRKILFAVIFNANRELLFQTHSPSELT